MKSFGRRPQDARLERIKASPLWAGEGFRNSHPVMPGLRDPNAKMPTVSEFLCGGERRFPLGPLPSMNPLETWGSAPASGLRATWLGHSTVLIEIDGVRVLTDPVWGLRASPSQLAGPGFTARDSLLGKSIRSDRKGKISVALYAVAISMAFVNVWIAAAIYAGVAAMWFVPAPRIENNVA